MGSNAFRVKTTRLFQQAPTNLAAGASLVIVANVEGQGTVTGSFFSALAVAAGTPLIEESTDGINWRTVSTVAASGSAYPFTFAPQAPYIRITFTQGAGAGSVSGWVEARPDSAGGSSSSSVTPLPPSPAANTKLAISFTAAGLNTVIPGTPGLVTRIYHYTFIAEGSTSLTFRDGATAYSGAMPLVSTQGLTFDAPGGIYPITLAAGADWVISNLNAIGIRGFVIYTQS